MTAQSQTALCENLSARKWVRLFPIVFFMGYLNLTVFLFMVGPWEFPVESAFRLYLYLFSAHSALLVGYLSGISRESVPYSGNWSIQKFVRFSVIISLVLLLPTSHFRTGSFIPNVLEGILNPGDAYANSYTLRESGEPLIEYVRIFLGPFLYMALPLTVFYWKNLTPKLRLGGVASMTGTVLLFIAMGTNKAIADTVLLVPALLFAAYCAGRIRPTRKQITIAAALALAGFLLFLAYFGFAVSSRQGSTVAEGYFLATHTRVDEDNFLIRNLPPAPSAALIGLDIYLTQGYYALSLSLQEPFVPMFGVGNSMFLYRQASRITGNPRIVDMPYPVRIEKYGWDAVGLWSSIYPWIASDISFPGTIILIFFVGRLFAFSWLDSVGGENPLGVVMFSFFVIILFYFPANNQMLQSGEGFTAFWGVLYFWLRSRRKAPSVVYGRQAPQMA